MTDHEKDPFVGIINGLAISIVLWAIIGSIVTAILIIF